MVSYSANLPVSFVCLVGPPVRSIEYFELSLKSQKITYNDDIVQICDLADRFVFEFELSSFLIFG